MKFVAFNLVVGAALAYLVVADRWDTGNADMPARAISTAVAEMPSPPVAPVPAPVVEPRPVAVPASPAPVSAPPIRRDPAPVPQIIPASAPDPVRIGGRVTPTPEPAPLDTSPQPAVPVEPSMSTAERGRSLRDLAREMEGRFVSGVQ